VLPFLGIIILEVETSGKGAADIEDLVAGWADKQPFHRIVLAFQHGMKAVLIAAQGADPQLIFKLQRVNTIIHETSLPEHGIGMRDNPLSCNHTPQNHPTQ
jgi:hypothetical protein